MAVNPVPEGYHTITPYLIISGAADAIALYRRAFGATEVMRMPGPGGKIGHAELLVGDSRIMLADEYPEMGARSAKTLGGSPIMLHLYVHDVDAWAERAIAAGLKVKQPIEDKFYGDRGGSFEDPFGLVWHLSTHQEDVPIDELGRRATAMAKQSEGDHG
jgi:PhnB protein